MPLDRARPRANLKINIPGSQTGAGLYLLRSPRFDLTTLALCYAPFFGGAKDWMRALFIAIQFYDAWQEKKLYEKVNFGVVLPICY